MPNVPGSCSDLAEIARSDDRLGKLTKLAEVLQGLPHDFSRAVGRLHDVVQWLGQGHVGAPEEEAPPMIWLGKPAGERCELVFTQNMYYGHLPDTSWQLLARFHRMPAVRH